jgi:hypothetical protein
MFLYKTWRFHFGNHDSHGSSYEIELYNQAQECPILAEGSALISLFARNRWAFDQRAINAFIKAGYRLSSPKVKEYMSKKVGTHYGFRVSEIPPPFRRVAKGEKEI